jgi:ABC-type microcin C transport system duplicated ATPase subunit YejF
MVAGLLEATAGEVLFEGKNIKQLDNTAFRRYRQTVQIIHQDPYASLNPTQTISQILTAPLLRHNKAKNRAAPKRARSKFLKSSI